MVDNRDSEPVAQAELTDLSDSMWTIGFKWTIRASLGLMAATFVLGAIAGWIAASPTRSMTGRILGALIPIVTTVALGRLYHVELMRGLGNRAPRH